MKGLILTNERIGYPEIIDTGTTKLEVIILQEVVEGFRELGFTNPTRSTFWAAVGAVIDGV